MYTQSEAERPVASVPQENLPVEELYKTVPDSVEQSEKPSWVKDPETRRFVVEAEPVTARLVVVALVMSAVCDVRRPESVSDAPLIVPVAVREPRYASPFTERRAKGELVLIPTLPEFVMVRREIPDACASKIFPAPVWFKVRSVCADDAWMVEVASVRTSDVDARPSRRDAVKADGTVPRIFLGDISPSQTAVTVEEPISTPRYSGWFQLKSAGNAVTEPSMTLKRPFETVTRLPPVRTSSQMFVVVALTLVVYRRKAMLYVPSTTAMLVESVSLPW